MSAYLIVNIAAVHAAAAREWWGSAAYASLREVRQASTTTHMILVEGVANAGGDPS